MRDLLVTEIFHSLQGEGAFTGERFSFIRLTGCNLRCTYCDSSYAFKNGLKRSITEVLTAIAPFKTKHVLLTGGEPLLQRQTPALVQALHKKNYLISIETHGQFSFASVREYARIVMDIKTPGSGMYRDTFYQNIDLLRSSDEVKFVLTSKNDYKWAQDLILSEKTLNRARIIFSPAVPAPNMPGSFEGVSLKWVAEKIIEDQLPVRLQTQFHKTIWGNQRGV